MATKNNINDYKDRMSAPMGAVLIDPKTKKPIKNTTKSTSKKPAKRGKK